MSKFYAKRHTRDYTNERIKTPPPETVIPNVWYAITISKSCTNANTLNKALHGYIPFVRDYLNPFTEYKLYPEISHVGRLHYHGRIRFKNFENIFNFYFLLGFLQDIALEIDTIADADVWKAYYKKSAVFKFIFEQHQLPYKLKRTEKV